jgi:hypothetical protein
MAKKVYNPKTGKMEWVGDDGKPLTLSQVNPGLGSLPGRATAREAELLARLPDAQLAGFSGPSVVDPKVVQGARPGEPDPVPPHTYRPLAGLKQNSRGASRVLELGGSASISPQQINSFIETPRNNGDDAELIAVTLGYELQERQSGLLDPADPAPYAGLLTEFYPTAVIEWGIGGATFSAEVDWALGTRVVLCASSVKVGFRLPAVNLGIAPFNVIFSAGLSYASGHVSKPPRLTVNPLPPPPAPQGLAAGASTSYVVIPNFAESFVVTQGSMAFRPLSVVLVDGFLTNEPARYLIDSPSNLAHQNERAFPIPNGAKLLLITNAGAGPTTSLRVIFSLAL